MLARTRLASLSATCGVRTPVARMATTTNIFHDYQLEGEADMQFVRSMGHTYEMGGDVCEMMLAANACGKGDDAEKWFEVWDALARKTQADAMYRIETNPVGAASAFMRASNYFRTSVFFLRGTPAANDRVKKAYSMCNEALGTAAPHLDPPLMPATLPMRDGSFAMPAYYAKAKGPPVGLTRSPLFICLEGYDSELWDTIQMGKRAVSYGFNLLVFEGPGQGGSATPHDANTTLRHDYEAALSSAIDGAASVCGFDLDAGIIVCGSSLGGHYIARCALTETRPTAYIADPINPSLKLAVEQMLPPPLWQDVLSHEAPSTPKTRAAFEGLGVKAYHKLASRAQAHGIDVSQAGFAFPYFRESLKWHVDVADFEKLQVPLIMMSAEADTISGSGAAEALMPHIQKSPVADDCSLIPMASSEGAGLHCSLGARSLWWERAMDKLLPLLRKKLG